MNDFDWEGKCKHRASKTLRVYTKNEENFEIFQENFENFWSKFTFSQFFRNIFLDFWLRSESIDLWKITPDFFNIFLRFRGGGTFRRSHSSRRYWTPNPEQVKESLEEKFLLWVFSRFRSLVWNAKRDIKRWKFWDKTIKIERGSDLKMSNKRENFKDLAPLVARFHCLALEFLLLFAFWFQQLFVT